MKICKNWLQERIGPLSLPDLAPRLEALGWIVPHVEEDFLEINENPARPDCLCLLGMAREAAAALGRTLSLPAGDFPESDAGSVFEYLDVEVPSEHCLRYCARMAANVRVGPSPAWLRERLRISGTEPANNLQDIAAWVRLETGQQVKILDYRLVPEGGFLIRDSFPGEEIPTDDGSVLILTEEVPVISDETYQALAPMDGLPPAIEADCSLVVLEVCCCDRDPLPDPLSAYPALDRACHLVHTLAEGDILDGTLDVLNYVPQPRTLALQELEGLPHPDRALEALETLGCVRQEDLLVLPSFRPDLCSGEDLRQEAARVLKN